MIAPGLPSAINRAVPFSRVVFVHISCTVRAWQPLTNCLGKLACADTFDWSTADQQDVRDQDTSPAVGSQRDAARARSDSSPIALFRGKLPVKSGLTFLAAAALLVSVFTRDSTTSAEEEELLFDPQTSGGLLLSVPADQAEDLINELKQAGVETAARVAEVIAGERPLVRVV